MGLRKIFFNFVNGFFPALRIISEAVKTSIHGGFVMKKLFLGVLTGVLVLSAGSIQVSAACHGGGRHCGTANRSCIVAAETDADTLSCSSNCYLDEDADGICDHCSADHGSCADGECFIDADNDGICDNCNAYHRCNSADGSGPCYVDENGNDVCDNYENQTSCHSGRNHRSGHHGSRSRHCR